MVRRIGHSALFARSHQLNAMWEEDQHHHMCSVGLVPRSDAILHLGGWLLNCSYYDKILMSTAHSVNTYNELAGNAFAIASPSSYSRQSISE